MTIFDTKNLDNKITRFPSPGPAPGFFESLGIGFDVGQQSTSTAINAAKLDRIGRIMERAKDQGLTLPTPPLQTQGPQPGQFGAPQAGRANQSPSLDTEIERFLRELREKNDRLPEGAPQSIEEINQSIREEFNQTEAEFQEVQERGSSIAGFAGAIAGGTADPIVLATLPLGAPAATSIVRTAAIEAGIGGLSEVPIQGLVQSQRADVGLESGFGRAAVNVATAAAGAGILGGGIKAAAQGARAARDQADRVLQSRRTQRQGPRTIGEALRPSIGPDIETAARIAKRRVEAASDQRTADVPSANRQFQEANQIDVPTLRTSGRNIERSPEGPISQESIDRIGIQTEVSNSIRDIAPRIRQGEEAAQQFAEKITKPRVRGQQEDLKNRSFLNEVENPEQFVRGFREVERARKELKEAAAQREEATKKFAITDPNKARSLKGAATRKEKSARERLRNSEIGDDASTLEALRRDEDQFVQAAQALQRLVGPNPEDLTRDQLSSAIRMEQFRQQTAREADTEVSSSNPSFKGASRTTARQEQAEKVTVDDDIERMRTQLQNEVDSIEEGDDPLTIINEDGTEDIPLEQALDELDDQDDILSEIDSCLGGSR